MTIKEFLEVIYCFKIKTVPLFFSEVKIEAIYNQLKGDIFVESKQIKVMKCLPFCLKKKDKNLIAPIHFSQLCISFIELGIVIFTFFLCVCV